MEIFKNGISPCSGALPAEDDQWRNNWVVEAGDLKKIMGTASQRLGIGVKVIGESGSNYGLGQEVRKDQALVLVTAPSGRDETLFADQLGNQGIEIKHVAMPL